MTDESTKTSGAREIGGSCVESRPPPGSGPLGLGLDEEEPDAAASLPVIFGLSQARRVFLACFTLIPTQTTTA